MKNILLLAALFLVGCGKKPEQTGAESASPTIIGTATRADSPYNPVSRARGDGSPSLPTYGSDLSSPESQRNELLEQAKASAQETWDKIKQTVQDKSDRDERAQAVTKYIEDAKKEALGMNTVGMPQIVEAAKKILDKDITEKYIEPLAKDEKSVPLLGAFLADLAHVNNVSDRLTDGSAGLLEKAVMSASLPTDLKNLQESTLAIQDRLKELKVSSGDMFTELKKVIKTKIPELPELPGGLMDKLPQFLKDFFRSKDKTKDKDKPVEPVS